MPRRAHSFAIPSPSPAWVLRGIMALLALSFTLVLELSPQLPHPAADSWMRDLAMRAWADATPETRLAVVDIDEASIARVGPWPWPRERIADMMEILLSRYQARGVALDMVLPEPADGSGDARLASMASNAPVVLAEAFDYVARPRPLRVGSLTTPRMVAPGAAATAMGYVANHAGLAEARCAGNIGFIPDPDGVLRSIPLVTRFAGHGVPTLALALLDCADGAIPAALPPRPPDGLWRLPFSRAWSAYTVVSAHDVLTEQLPEDVVKGRYLIIGSSAFGLGDRVATPLTASTSGTMVHAAALTTLLDDRDGLAAARWPGHLVAIAFAILAANLALVGFPRLAAGPSIALLTLATVLWLGLAMIIIPHDAHFSPSAPLFTLLALLGTAVPFEWGRSQRESRQLLDMFRHYVAQPVLDELLRHREEVDPLAPRHLEVTTLISDMEGYAALCEGSSLEDAVALTRGFLDCLTGPVLEHGGTLDKYTGDGLMAFWGAPLPLANHADRALDAARDIRLRVAAFNADRIAAGKPPVRVRVGLESGLAVVGDLGTPFRSAYTAVGDSVNIASRLQELARELPYDIILGSTTARLASRHRLRSLGTTQLRGRNQPLEIFTLDGIPASQAQGADPAIQCTQSA